VVVTEVLEAVRAPPAVTAGEDRPEEHAVTLLDPRGKDRTGADLLENSHRFMAEDPRRRGPGIAVEERPGVGATDAAGLDVKDRAARIQGGISGLADFGGVDARHVCRSHAPTPGISSSSSA
jgi:hypothetical protein